MKKVFLALAVAAVFVACDSKKKEGEEKKEPGTEQPATPAPNAGDTMNKTTPAPNAGDTMNKTAAEAGKTAVEAGKAAVEAGKTAVEAGKDAVKKATN